MRRMTNYYRQDPNLKGILQHMLPEDFFKWADEELDAFGALCAGPIDERAVHTDREGQPRLIRYDKMGEEVSQVWLNEGYKQTITDTYHTGIVGYVHKEIPELGRKGNYVYSFAQAYLLSHAEAGFYCPVTLSKATAYLIDHYASSKLKEQFLPHVLSTGDVELYEGATFLTERQGGSDVGANEVKAVKDGDAFRISGEKYFASNAGTCGVAMVLARIEGAPNGTKGLSLFLVPWEENRTEGLLRIRRLKDKLGVRAVPSAEVEFENAKGYLVGEENQGFYYMIEALNLSRVSNAIASLGIMKRAYLEARNYALQREAFGSKLTNYPMVQATLSKLVAKQEVEMNAMFEVIQLMDQVMGKETKTKASQKDQLLFRLYVAIMKKETAEQAIHFAHEAIEMHGGNGYIEDFVTPRLLRDAQVLTVWEGTANILGLEVLRLIGKYNVGSLFVEEMLDRLENAHGIDEEIDVWVRRLVETTNKLDHKIKELKEKSPQLQTYYCKQIAENMATIFESVVAVDLMSKNDSRKKSISEVYLHTVWNHDDDVEEPVELERFKELVMV
ncbi:isovaleryl-CoA dehydrogenase [Ornithinibacillus sp. L9]|uniref:Isovaleryl-CoA dehydrogenase n=1 Tax=Ornithinibacillus caprae TaxID=2678566 RepID=A0A6N8FKX0_9BACI|nr:acyl-CoA dehydrogenase family protein [Ornithinibacillus caprae]MUK88994.1 isovaleryl-CoA dehydrogenase [Ornithinibacillus caprae]